MRRNDYFGIAWTERKESDGESLKDGLSINKPLRGPCEDRVGRELSTDYYEPLTPKVEK